MDTIECILMLGKANNLSGSRATYVLNYIEHATSSVNITH